MKVNILQINANFTYTLNYLLRRLLLEQTQKSRTTQIMILNQIEVSSRKIKNVIGFLFDYRNLRFGVRSRWGLQGENVALWVDLSHPNYCQQISFFFF